MSPPRFFDLGVRLRSLAVSLFTTLIDAGLFALCTVLLCGFALVWARWLCGAVGAVCNFALNRVWAFRSRGSALFAQLGRYSLMAGASVTLATVIWWLLRALTGADPRLLHLASLGIVWLAFSFPLLRRWVFASEQAQKLGHFQGT